MNKVICDICGTSYPDTADQCPICGYSRELNGDHVLDDIAAPVTEEFIPDPIVEEEEDFVPVAVAPAVPEFDLEEEQIDLGNADDVDFDVDVEGDEDDEDEGEDDEDDDEDEDEDDEEDEPRSNTGLVVILVILIVALLGVMGFIAFRYLLPNLNIGKETEPVATTTAPIETTAPVVTTEPTIPCEALTMVSEGSVILEEEGASWLINVAATPENTTDKIIYASSDENVVTVTEDGKLTAVGQGEAVITVTCGEQLLQCKVTCFFIEETTAPTETTAPETFPDETTAPTEETEPEEETTAPTEPEETQKPSTGNGEVTLTLKKTDITFSVVPAFYTLEFEEEDIDMDQVKWVTSDGNVAICHGGKLQVVGYGLCKITAEYKGVKAECVVRVVAR